MATYYIEADVHVNNTELAVEYRHKIVQRYSVPTSIPAISAVLGSLQGKKFLAIEEGSMAGCTCLRRECSMEMLRVAIGSNGSIRKTLDNFIFALTSVRSTENCFPHILLKRQAPN